MIKSFIAIGVLCLIGMVAADAAADKMTKLNACPAFTA